MLSNSIALVTLAVMLASEATRAAPPWNKGLWTLATLVTLVALGLGPITTQLPAIGPFLSSIFGQPASWFVLFIGLFLVLRPFWVKAPDTTVDESVQRIKALGGNAFNIAGYVSRYRATKRVFREDLPDIGKAVMEGISLLMSLEKEGFATPKLNNHNKGPYAAAVAMEQFFGIIAPLIRDGHIDEVRSEAAEIAKSAEETYSQFNVNNFWTSHGW